MHNFSEINKDVLLALLLAIASGALMGIISQIIKDIFTKIRNQPATSNISKLKSYADVSFMFGIPMGMIAFIGLIFNTATPIKNVREFVFPYVIIGGPSIVLVIQIFQNFVFKSEDN
ncbi:hypothetical protein Riv7116_1921 [Rivularia sp. PCC 7116]|uniref:hypothetical protein n=1 Tax=Rivularia sp. PCC 7116 TaxID=373994 RepID=UPI00029EFAFF|nr:hypothetical protein [Rivularia sp. PCC 7116]AFY54461.1 hypothetical protein Riv7116_1921 [Rivularia sp. PCC 7116]